MSKSPPTGMPEAPEIGDGAGVNPPTHGREGSTQVRAAREGAVVTMNSPNPPYRAKTCEANPMKSNPVKSNPVGAKSPASSASTRRCASGGCVGPDDCCPGEWRCRDGACVPRHQCCSNERRCSDGSCVSAGACCASEKLCPDGSCIAANSCCPDSPRPHCKDCQELACQNGEWVCWGECECTLDCDEETGACKTLGCGPNEICMQGKCQAQCTSEFPACVVLRSDGIPYFVGCCWEGSHCSKTWYGMGWCCPDSHERCY